ncbi:hypothetical protein MBANPS3_002795, partial [Mucor bainieri]
MPQDLNMQEQGKITQDQGPDVFDNNASNGKNTGPDDSSSITTDSSAGFSGSAASHLGALEVKPATKEKPVNLKDIPRFQLEGHPKHFSEYPSLESLEYFFSAFEVVIAASVNDIEQVWKQYIQVAIPFAYTTWLNNDLLPCANCTAAKALFIKHYGTPVNELDRISELFSLRMAETDTLQEYTNCIVKRVQEAGFSLSSRTLAKFYQALCYLMLNRHDAKHRWTINEVYECVLPLFVADEQARGRPAKGKRKAAEPEGRPHKKSTKATTGFYCPKHGGDKADHNAADCRSLKKSLGSDNKPNRASASTSAAGRPIISNICTYCGKERGFKHWCKEFFEAKQTRQAGRKDIHVHTVKTSSGTKSGNDTGSLGDSTPDDDTVEEIDAVMDEIQDEIDAEESSLECESVMKRKHESFNPFLLLPPILLKSKECKPVRLVAKIVTEADGSFLNKNIFYNKLHFTSDEIIPVEGNLTFLSHSVKRLGKTPAFNIRYLNDISFHHSFELADFFMKDLGDFDVLLGVDTLSQLRIGLTSVAHQLPVLGDLTEDEKSELLETIDFQNVNYFDTKNAIDPETASIFHSKLEEHRHNMSYIQDAAIDENLRVKPGTTCNVPESKIFIPCLVK